MSKNALFRSVFYNRKIEYDILSCSHVFDISNSTLASIGAQKGSKRFIVLDENLEMYKSAITSYFSHSDIDAHIVLFEAGETNKTLQKVVELLEELETFPIRRRDEPLIAIGGGVLTDVVGFAAGLYRRGMPHIKIPTTLMGYVDAAIGIKCGINFNNQKNRVGSFEPPLKVLLDPTFLKTLSDRHILNGVGEIIKLAIIRDAGLFKQLEKMGNSCIQKKFQGDDCQGILDQSINIMIDELAPNLYEENLSRSVDFGHTFSLAYEMEANCDLLHGEAVVIDIVLSLFLAKIKGILSSDNLNRMLNLIRVFNYNFSQVFLESDILWNSILERQRHRNGLQRIPLPHAVGEHVFVNDVTFHELDNANVFLENWMYENGYLYKIGRAHV